MGVVSAVSILPENIGSSQFIAVLSTSEIMLRRLNFHRDVEAYTPPPHPLAFGGVLGRISSKFVEESIFGSRKVTRTLLTRPLNSTNRCAFDE